MIDAFTSGETYVEFDIPPMRSQDFNAAHKGAFIAVEHSLYLSYRGPAGFALGDVGCRIICYMKYR
jgi:hypothetical protein